VALSICCTIGAVDGVSVQAGRPLVRRNTLSEADRVEPPRKVKASLAQLGDDDDDSTQDDFKSHEHSSSSSKASPEEVDNMMEAMDVNQDGVLSWNEVVAFFNRDGSSDTITAAELEAGGFGPMTTPEKNELKEMFDTTDSDHDGKLNKVELAKFLSAEEANSEKKFPSQSERPEEDVEAEDENDELPSDAVSLAEQGSKSMTKEEEDEEILASFADADTNKDGLLSLAEVVEQLEREEAEEAHKEGRKYNSKAAVNAEARKEAMDKFKEADKDGNNLLTKAEFTAIIQSFDEKEEEEEAKNMTQKVSSQPKKEDTAEGDKSEEELDALSGASEDEAGSED